MKYYISTFGCQMNKSDAERVASVLENLGYEKIDKESEADLICVVACSVRQSAIDRIYGRARKWQKIKKTRGLITILTGCVLDADKPKMAKIFDVIFEIKDLNKLPKLVRDKRSEISNKGKTTDHLSLIPDYFEINPIHQSSFQAFIPISTGCNNFCSYCVVPYTRGREISRPAKEIIAEVRSLVADGYKEITLLGQNVNSYGISRQTTDNRLQKKTTFPKLLKMINDIPGNFWIRFLTSHPKDMSEELIKTVAECEKVTPHIHLPVQSGDDEILKRMNRHYTAKKYLKLVSYLRSLIPDICLSTDIIVGFPSETKKQFENTAKLMEEVKFDMAYLSQYSPRPETAAYKLKDDVSKKEKDRREKILNDILKKTALESNKKYVGKEVEILVEGSKGDKSNIGNKGNKNLATLSGRTRNFKNIQFVGPKTLVGKFIKVKIIDYSPWGLKGKFLKKKTPSR